MGTNEIPMRKKLILMYCFNDFIRAETCWFQNNGSVSIVQVFFFVVVIDVVVDHFVVVVVVDGDDDDDDFVVFFIIGRQAR